MPNIPFYLFMTLGILLGATAFVLSCRGEAVQPISQPIVVIKRGITVQTALGLVFIVGLLAVILLG